MAITLKDKVINTKKIRIALIIILAVLIAIIIFLQLRPEKNKKRDIPVKVERAPSDVLYNESSLKYEGKNIRFYYDKNGNLIVVVDGVEYMLKDGIVYKIGKDGKLVMADTKISDLVSNAIGESDNETLEDLDTTQKSKLQIMAEEQGVDYKTIAKVLEDKGYSEDDFVDFVEDSGKTLKELVTPAKKKTVNNNILVENKIKSPIQPIKSTKTEGVSFAKTIPGLNFKSKSNSSSKNNTNDQSVYKDKADLINALSKQNQESNIEDKNIDFLKQYNDGSNKYYINNQSIAVGTIISMNLLSGVNTDLPGAIVAMVDQNVYDSITGQNLLIPKGTKLFASYSSSIVFGQKRLLVAWTHLIRPDGFAMDLPGFQGVDVQGFAGYKDNVNNHILPLIGATLLSSLMNFGTGEIVSQAERAKNKLAIGGVNAASETTQTVGSKYLSLWINRKPTLIIRPGKEIKLLVNKTLELPIYQGVLR